jgi:4-hydroxy-4-methyl-2-oxoglutarate aldolase
MKKNLVFHPQDTGDQVKFEALRKHLFSAVIGDLLDQLGYQNQFLPQAIKPIKPSMVLVGRAMTVVETDIAGADKSKFTDAKPFGKMFEALDDLKSNEIYVASGSSLSYALWGGLMTARAQKLGAAGALLHGYHRDSNEILQIAMPVFSMGSYAQDQAPRGKVVDWRVPIEIASVTVHSGDLLFGDLDGVVVVPRAVETEVINLALEKVQTENKVRRAIENGMSTVEAFNKFGVM